MKNIFVTIIAGIIIMFLFSFLIYNHSKNGEHFINNKNDLYNIAVQYLTEEEYQATLDKMWEQLSDIPVNNTGEIIEDNFYIWKKGTLRDNIWHWFDERVQSGIGKKYFN